MSEEATTPVEAPQIAEGTRSPVESKVSTEVAPNKSQESTEGQSSEVNQLIAEAKKYRSRAQQSETQLTKLQKQIDSDRQKQLEDQNEWQQLAEERASRIAELEPIVEMAQQDEARMREEILADLSDEDRETFGDLPLSKLRAIHNKLVNNQRLAVANNPAVAANEVPKDWTNMNRNDRAKNWDSIVARYRK
jgi:TolA-binding protein|tara:strand:+ start:1350 stop:1925 length:576 start_codon:yes stop_codon:yes gene_type:complete